MKNLSPSKTRLILSPNLFRFGGSTKPISKILFDKYDVDHNGFISMEEFRFLCYDLGYFLSDQQFEWAKIYLDKDGNQRITYDEFAIWWQNPSRFDHILLNDQQLNIFHQIIQLFRSFDEQNQGNLTEKQFENLFDELIRRQVIDKGQSKQFDEIDRSKDEKINFNEFISWLQQQNILEKLKILPSNIDSNESK